MVVVAALVLLVLQFLIDLLDEALDLELETLGLVARLVFGDLLR